MSKPREFEIVRYKGVTSNDNYALKPSKNFGHSIHVLEQFKVIEHSAYQRLLDANKKLEKTIAKELSENDEFGAEFVHVNILKNEIAKLKDANKKLLSALKSAKGFVDEYDNVGFAKLAVSEALSEANKIEGGE